MSGALGRVTKAYLFGALHDATKRKTTYRIAQKSREYVEFLAKGIKQLGYSAWTYKEGKKRSVYIVEFSQFVLDGYNIKTQQDKIDYIRGYFDTEGGIAKSLQVRFYIYFAQKDLSDLKQLRQYLEEFGIICGKIHNPSKKADPNYWRFFISVKSYRDFACFVGSWHSEKSRFLRMKI